MGAQIGNRIEEQKRLWTLGNRTEVLPIPPVPENTQYATFGRLSIGVEYRELNDNVVVNSFDAGDRNLDILSVDHAKQGFKEGDLDEAGPSVHIIDADTGQERIRFDLFPGDPHYHYIPSPDYQYLVPYDPIATGDYFEFVLNCIENQLPGMLRFVGANDFADAVETLERRPIAEQVREMKARASLVKSQSVPVGAAGKDA